VQIASVTTTKNGRPIGRPSLGPRDEFKIRFPVSVGRAARLAAAAEGKTLNGFVAELVAQHVADTSQPASTYSSNVQDELPLSA